MIEVAYMHMYIFIPGSTELQPYFNHLLNITAECRPSGTSKIYAELSSPTLNELFSWTFLSL